MNWTDLEMAVSYGTVLTHNNSAIRIWVGLWLQPGEFLIEHHGNRYIVSGRPADSTDAASEPQEKK